MVYRSRKRLVKHGIRSTKRRTKRINLSKKKMRGGEGNNIDIPDCLKQSVPFDIKLNGKWYYIGSDRDIVLRDINKVKYYFIQEIINLIKDKKCNISDLIRFLDKNITIDVKDNNGNPHYPNFDLKNSDFYDYFDSLNNESIKSLFKLLIEDYIDELGHPEPIKSLLKKLIEDYIENVNNDELIKSLLKKLFDYYIKKETNNDELIKSSLSSLFKEYKEKKNDSNIIKELLDTFILGKIYDDTLGNL